MFARSGHHEQHIVLESAGSDGARGCQCGCAGLPISAACVERLAVFSSFASFEECMAHKAAPVALCLGICVHPNSTPPLCRGRLERTEQPALHRMHGLLAFCQTRLKSETAGAVSQGERRARHASQRS